MLKIEKLRLPPGVPEEQLLPLAARALHVPEAAVRSLHPVRRSLDARGEEAVWEYTVHAVVEDEGRVLKKCRSRWVTKAVKEKYHPPKGAKSPALRPVVVGAGPAGLFCALILAQAGYLQYTDEQDNASRLLFTLQRDELYKLREQDDKTELLVRTLLRSYTGLFTDYAFINEDSLATRTGLNRRQVYEILMRLSKQHILKYIPRKKTPYIIYTRERLDVDEIILPPSIYDERKQQYEKRINAMLDYVDDEIACRSRKLLRYFGEKNEHECGQCDVCLGRKHGKKEYSEQSLRSELLELLSGETLTPADVAARFNVEREVLANVLRQLLDNGEIVAINGMLQLKK